MPLPTTTASGQLDIDGILVGVNQYGAWRITDLPRLWVEATQRGGDRILPGAAGVKPYRRRRTVTTFDLEMQIVGDVAGDTGNLATNFRSVLFYNLKYLNAALVNPASADADGTHPSTLIAANGETFDAPVTVLGLVPHAMYPNLIVADLTISIPRGTYMT